MPTQHRYEKWHSDVPIRLFTLFFGKDVEPSARSVVVKPKQAISQVSSFSLLGIKPPVHETINSECTWLWCVDVCVCMHGLEK